MHQGKIPQFVLQYCLPTNFLIDSSVILSLPEMCAMRTLNITFVELRYFGDKILILHLSQLRKQKHPIVKMAYHSFF